MKRNIKSTLHIMALAMVLGGTMPIASGCADDDMSKSIADYDPRYKGEVAFGNSD